MAKYEKFLKFYIEKILYGCSYLEPPLSYSILPYTGHLFRDWSDYTPTITLKGGLKVGKVALNSFLGLNDKEAKHIINEFLKFESRTLIENYWIIKKKKNKMLQSINEDDIFRLTNLLQKKQSIVFITHSVNVTLMIFLLELLGTKASVMKGTVPIHSSLHNYMAQTYEVWEQYQKHTKGKALDAKATIKEGFSLLIAGDIPYPSGCNIKIFNKEVTVAPGAVKLSYKFDLPLLVAVPWARGVESKYNIVIEEIKKTGNIVNDLQNIFKICEKAILNNPSCWMGWMAFGLGMNNE
jgi:lauroyl/myristoyl acyltransferase